MKPRDLLIVGARLIGLWYITVAIDDLRTVLDIATGIFIPSRTTTINSPIVICVVHAMIGLFLFLFAHRLADVVSSRVQADDGPPSEQ